MYVPDVVFRQARFLAGVEATVCTNPTGVAIVHDGKHFRYYNVSAWTKPDEQGFLPWSGPPAWPILYVVQDDGSVEGGA